MSLQKIVLQCIFNYRNPDCCYCLKTGLISHTGAFLLCLIFLLPPLCQDKVSYWPFSGPTLKSDHLINCIMVIILYSVNFIAVWEGVDNSCWLSFSPSYLSSLTEVILTRSYLGGGAHLLIEKWLTNQELHDGESRQPISSLLIPADDTQQAMKENWRWCFKWRGEGVDAGTSQVRVRQEGFGKRATEAESFIVIPGGEAIQATEIPSVSAFKSEQ